MAIIIIINLLCLLMTVVRDRRVYAYCQDASTVVRVVNKLDRRRILLNTRSTCRGEILYSPEFRKKTVEGIYATLMLDIPVFPYNAM